MTAVLVLTAARAPAQAVALDVFLPEDGHWGWMFRSGENVGPRTVLEEGELHLLASWGLHLPGDAEQC